MEPCFCITVLVDLQRRVYRFFTTYSTVHMSFQRLQILKRIQKGHFRVHFGPF